MTISPAEFETALFAAVVACLATGLVTSVAVRDAYEQLGHGELALDVPDRIEPPPLESPSGQAEVQQLLDAIATVGADGRDRHV